MKLYAGTTEQFMADTQLHRIAEKLRNEYIAAIGHKPGAAEFNSWQNSLQALALLINQAELEDHGVILEYQLGNTSKRLDAMLTGRSATSAQQSLLDNHSVSYEADLFALARGVGAAVPREVGPATGESRRQSMGSRTRTSRSVAREQFPARYLTTELSHGIATVR